MKYLLARRIGIAGYRSGMFGKFIDSDYALVAGEFITLNPGADPVLIVSAFLNADGIRSWTTRCTTTKIAAGGAMRNAHTSGSITRAPGTRWTNTSCRGRQIGIALMGRIIAETDPLCRPDRMTLLPER